jgi:Ca-activated chloride channel family protein
MASRRLQESGLPGSIVLVADSVDPALADAIESVHEQEAVEIHVYAVAAGPEVVPPAGSPPAPALDEGAMRAVARAGGGALVSITPDDSDVRLLGARVQRSIASAPVQEGERWKDAGYFLVWPLLLIMLPAFRRGGGVVLS